MPTIEPRRHRLPSILVLAALGILLAAASAVPAAAKPRAHKPPKSPLGVGFVKPPTLTEGTRAAVRVRIVDRGRRPLRKVVVAVRSGAGVAVAPKAAKVKLLRPGKARTLAFGVTVAPGTAAPTLAIVARAKGVPPAKRGLKLKTAPAPLPPPEGISGRYFFNSTLVLNTTYVEGYYFVDDKFAYRGIPEGGLPQCTQATAQGDGDGCLPYTYDPATGALNVAGAGGEFKLGSHLLKVGDDSFSETVPVAAGTRLDASGEYINGSGLCPYCTFVTSSLQLTSAGAFARSSAVSGSTPETDFAALPPDQHGTYAVDARGHIVFTYADGHVVADTFAILLDHANNPDPNYGMLLDDRIFFGPHSDV